MYVSQTSCCCFSICSICFQYILHTFYKNRKKTEQLLPAWDLAEVINVRVNYKQQYSNGSSNSRVQHLLVLSQPRRRKSSCSEHSSTHCREQHLGFIVSPTDSFSQSFTFFLPCDVMFTNNNCYVMQYSNGPVFHIATFYILFYVCAVLLCFDFFLILFQVHKYLDFYALRNVYVKRSCMLGY